MKIYCQVKIVPGSADPPPHMYSIRVALSKMSEVTLVRFDLDMSEIIWLALNKFVNLPKLVRGLISLH